MLGDLLYALPFAVVGLLGGLALDRARARAPERSGAVAAALAAAMLASALAAQFSHAFHGYVSDLWLYLTVAGRVADGAWVLDREPFWLEPPGSAMHSVLWIGLGLAERAVGLPPYLGARMVGFASLGLLSAAAWLIARDAFDEPAARWLALICFLAGLQQEWAALALNRNVAYGFVLLAIWRTLRGVASPRQAALLAGCVALAFYFHLFAGALALGGVALAAAARAWNGELRRAPVLVFSAAGGLALALPWLLLALPGAAQPVEAAHGWGPGQVELGGLRLFDPAAALRLSSPAVIALAAAGLLPRWRRLLRSPVGTLAWLAPCAALLLLLTPLYHLVTGLFGGWMAPRVASLALLWLPAAAALHGLGNPRGARAARVAAALGLAALFWLGGARVVRDFRHEELYHPFSATARAEARALRPLLHGEKYVSSPLLAYGLAPYTLGSPLAVPPGHASPVHPFAERERDVRRVFRDSSRECWAYLVARYPDLRFLVTPAPGARIERGLWARELPGRSPEEVRRGLEAWGAARPVHAGRHFVVDALDPRGLEAADAVCP